MGAPCIHVIIPAPLDEVATHPARPAAPFFYPAANTSVCAAEACHFRDLTTEFAALGASYAGISADAVDLS